MIIDGSFQEKNKLNTTKENNKININTIQKTGIINQLKNFTSK